MTDNANAGAAGGQDTQAGADAGDKGAGAGAGEPWYAKADYGLDQEAKDYLGGKNAQNFGDVIKSARHFEELARGRNVISAPVADKLMEWNGWNALGWDADPAKYSVPAPEAADDDYDKAFHASTVKIMHAAKVPPAQAKLVTDGIASLVKTQLDAADQMAREETKQMNNALERSWGGEAKKNREIARRAMQAFTVGKNDATLLETVTGSAGLVELFHRIGDMIGEDKLDFLGKQAGSPEMGPNAARAERLQLEQDPAFMRSLRDPRHPQHEESTSRRSRLLAIEAQKQAA